MICPQCKTENKNGERHCVQCSKFLAVSKPAPPPSSPPALVSNVTTNVVPSPTVDETMFCRFCGKKIPTESIFCMFCGKTLTGTISNNSSGTSNNNVPEKPIKLIPEKTPIAIDAAYLWNVGPTDVKRKLMRDAEIGRGFNISCSFVDSSNAWTTAEGTIWLGISTESNPQRADMRVIKTWKTLTASGLNKEKVFFKEISLKKSDFKWTNLIYKNTGKTSEELLFSYLEMNSLIYIPKDTLVYAHVWFQSRNGNLMYKRSDSRLWE